MADEHPAQLSAAEAARRMQQGLLTAEELVRGCLERVRQVEPTVQAWQFLDEEHALEQAIAADERRRSGQAVGALNGVPVGIKDIIDTGDMPTENGTAVHAGRTPRTDAAVVRQLRAAGAVILGKTVTTECAYFTPGKTRNPHNPDHTPGGSSSGSAAAVAASMVPLALGSQTAGSTIRPGSFCGVYSFKPSHGLIPRTGVLQLSRTLDHIGLFARSTEDIALLAEELAGYDEGDADTQPRARIPFTQVAVEEPPIAPKLAFIKTPHWERTDADLKDGYAELIETLGDHIEELELFPSAQQAWDWQRLVMDAEMAANLEPLWVSGKEKLSERLRSLIERGREVKAVDYQRVLNQLPAVRETFDELFMERYDAILTPSALGAAPKGLSATGDPVFCVPWTLFGLPAINVPLLRGTNGLPIGVQLVGRRNFDARLLRTARWLASQVA